MAMILLFVFLACMLTALGVGALAALSDMRGMTIPNSYSLVVIGAFIVAYAVLLAFDGPQIFFSLKSHILAALILFGVTVALFAAGLMGAADSKLGSAYALWVGIPGLPAFLFYTAIFGGLLAVMALAMRRWKFFPDPPAGSWPARVQAGESKVPYGVAIAVGALASFVKLGYLGPHLAGVFSGF